MANPPSAHEALMRAICAQGGHSTRAVVNVRTAAGPLGLELYPLYKAVLDLVDAGYLDYEGAGPRVRVTERGAELCGHLAQGLPPGDGTGRTAESSHG